jgi:hypothetical protein
MTTETPEQVGVGPGRGGRMSRQRKRDAVLRLLRGEDLETLSRALGATAVDRSSSVAFRYTLRSHAHEKAHCGGAERA